MCIFFVENITYIFIIKKIKEDEKLKKIKEMEPQDAYDYLKGLLKTQNVLLDDNYNYAYAESERIKGDVHFVSFTTGYNRDVQISFVEKDGMIISLWTHMHTNYGGYDCCLGDDMNIHEKIGHGFGGWTYVTSDLYHNKLAEGSEQNFGCCYN